MPKQALDAIAKMLDGGAGGGKGEGGGSGTLANLSAYLTLYRRAHRMCCRHGSIRPPQTLFVLPCLLCAGPFLPKPQP
jgi:hypothetical protein